MGVVLLAGQVSASFAPESSAYWNRQLGTAQCDNATWHACKVLEVLWHKQLLVPRMGHRETNPESAVLELQRYIRLRKKGIPEIH